jgi:hypothetical protein
VSRALFVRRAAALAGDLALLFGRHRREPTPFFAFSCSHRSALRFGYVSSPRTTYGPFWPGCGGGSWTRAGRGSSSGVSGASSDLSCSSGSSGDGFAPYSRKTSFEWTPIALTFIKLCAHGQDGTGGVNSSSF